MIWLSLLNFNLFLKTSRYYRSEHKAQRLSQDLGNKKHWRQDPDTTLSDFKVYSFQYAIFYLPHLPVKGYFNLTFQYILVAFHKKNPAFIQTLNS